jgi:hypothetical protein
MRYFQMGPERADVTHRPVALCGAISNHAALFPCRLRAFFRVGDEAVVAESEVSSNSTGSNHSLFLSLVRGPAYFEANRASTAKCSVKDERPRCRKA